jgi:hypothetical protein
MARLINISSNLLSKHTTGDIVFAYVVLQMTASCGDFLSRGLTEIAIVAKVYMGNRHVDPPPLAPYCLSLPPCSVRRQMSGSHCTAELYLGAPVSPTVGAGGPHISAASIDLYAPADCAAEEKPVAGRAFLTDQPCTEATMPEPVFGRRRRRSRLPKPSHAQGPVHVAVSVLRGR